MSEYRVQALDGRFETEVKADNEVNAKAKAAEEIMDELEGTIEVTSLKVYDVRLKYGGVKVGVVASTKSDAKHTARKFVEERQEEALEEVTHGTAAHKLLTDLNTGVKVVGVREGGHYEVNEDGEWEEGELDPEHSP
jgi:hypothetical protein